MNVTLSDFPKVSLPEAKLLIDGDWVAPASGETIPVINPSTEQEFTRIAKGSVDDVNQAVEAAHRCFESAEWQKMRPLDRGRLLEELARLIERDADELANLESWDNGKPIFVSRHIDLAFTIDALRYFAGWASKVPGEYITLSPFIEDGGQYRAYTERRPVGVVAGIMPWNFPLGQAIQKLAPSIAFGCTVVLKPSEETSLTTLRLGELVREAGFPRGAVNIITGLGADVGSALVEHPKVSKIAFTGSNQTGQRILKAATAQLKRVTLELGGKSPTIVLPDANIEQVIPGAAMAVFGNSGQVCTAGSRLFVHSSIYDQVIEGVAKFAQSLPIGHAFKKDVALGPLVSARQLQKVSGMVESGASQGAEVITGGARAEDQGYYYHPTIVANVDKDAALAREEIFGPVVVADRFDEIDEIKALANNTKFGLGGSIWTHNLNAAHLLASQIDAGTVWINTHNILDSAMPFGGVKMSGLGREFGSEAVHAFTEPKAVCMRLDPQNMV